MKLVVTHHDVQTNVSASSFPIGSNAKMFAILADKIYSDKPRAVIREYASNCLDIHKRIGQANPFKVSLPTDADPSITFRDYGTGLRHELVRTLFCTFFASDKTDSNVELGGFGLGSKAGFAYADAFTVTSFQDGVKSVYAAFRGADSEPKMSEPFVTETDEPDGLEVKIPVKQADWGTFEYVVKDVLRWFPEGSFKVYGAEVPAIKTEMRHDTWLSFKNPTSYTYVLMGAVAYRVDWGLLDLELPKGIVPIFKIGELDLPPSREQLSYDETTKARLRARYSEICEAFIPQVLREVMSLTPIQRLQKVKEIAASDLRGLFDAYHKARGNRAKDVAAAKAAAPARVKPKWGIYLLYDHERITIPLKARLLSRRKIRGAYSHQFRISDATALNPMEIESWDRLQRTVFLESAKVSRIQDRLNTLPGSIDHVYLVEGDAAPFLEGLSESHFGKLEELEPPYRERAYREKFSMLFHRSWGGNVGFASTYETNPESGVYVPFSGHIMDPAFTDLVEVKWAVQETTYGLTKKAMDGLDEDEFTRLDHWLMAKARAHLEDPTVIQALSADSTIAEAKGSPLWSFCAMRGRGGSRGLLDPQVAAVEALMADQRAVSTDTIISLRQMANMGLIKLPKPKDFHNVVKLLARAEKKNPLLIYLLQIDRREVSLDYISGKQDNLLKGIVR